MLAKRKYGSDSAVTFRQQKLPQKKIILDKAEYKRYNVNVSRKYGQALTVTSLQNIKKNLTTSAKRSIIQSTKGEKTMTKVNVIQKMITMADKIMKAYKTDLAYDFAILLDNRSINEYWWFVRETGTHLTADPEMLEAYKEYNEVMYHITLDDDNCEIVKEWQR